VKPLSISFECSILTIGEVPEDWRKPNVNFFLKTGKKERSENYRPVSLTSVFGKATEQLTVGTISRHMNEKKVRRSHQH